MKTKPQMLIVVGFAVCLLVATGWLISGLYHQNAEGKSSERLISLRKLPGISEETIAAQGVFFHIEEPLLYDRETKMGVFVAEILSSKNFEDETHVIIGGDARSLECFKNEMNL